MSDSAVQFSTNRRIHISLAVTDVASAVEFYRALFNTAPSKTRMGYARFEVSEPPLNLSVIESEDAQGPTDATSHFGIQVKSISAVDETRRRLETAGLATRIEAAVNCCHAVQDKFWIVDPNGHRWEIFVVLDDAPDTAPDPNAECCPVSIADACDNGHDEPCCTETP